MSNKLKLVQNDFLVKSNGVCVGRWGYSEICMYISVNLVVGNVNLISIVNDN